MAAKPKSVAPVQWDKDNVLYPVQNAICDVCGIKAEVKLAWDKRRFICINAARCLSRAHKKETEA